MTSAAESPRLGTIALGYVHRDFLAAGTKVEAATEGGRVPATVTERRSCQQLDQLFVRGRKAERREIGARHPPHLLPEQRPRLALQRAPIEVQRHGPVVVGVRDLEDELADVDVRVELFSDLAGQRRRDAFPPRRSCRRETPTGRRGGRPSAAASRETRRPSSMTAATTMITIWTCAGTSVHDRAIGHASHLGFRATQTVAPKSISA